MPAWLPQPYSRDGFHDASEVARRPGRSFSCCANTELPKQHARFALHNRMVACYARQDSWSDVQLLLAINVCLVVLGGWAKGVFIDPLESGAPHHSLWTNTYEVRCGRIAAEVF